MTKTHITESLDEVGTNSEGIHVNAISTTCTKHLNHMIDFYCSGHGRFGCCICKEVEHGKCKITSLEQMIDFCQSVPEKLGELKETFSNLLVKKQTEKEDLKAEVRKIEDEAIVFVERVKEKLDNMLENFKKQLTIYQEEENTKFNIRLRLLEQAIVDIHHWVSTIGIVKDTGTDEQLVIQTDVMKHQLKTTMEELFEKSKSDAIIKLDFDKDALLMKVESSDSIGALIQSKKALNGQLDDAQKCCFALNVPIKDPDVEYLKTISLPNDVQLKCGFCVDTSKVIVSSRGCYTRLNLVNRDTGKLISRSEYVIPVECNRMCYYSKGNKIFTSNHGHDIIVSSDNDSFTYLSTFSCNSSQTGAMDYFNGHVYVATGGTIKRFDPNNNSVIEKCCPSITNASAMGLKIHDGDAIFFTRDNKVKRCSLSGREVFSYSSPDIVSPISLVVLPDTGHVLVLDSKDGGKLHQLCADGSRHVTILETFKQVREPTDLWLGVDNGEVYISGGVYIEIYKLV